MTNIFPCTVTINMFYMMLKLMWSSCSQKVYLLLQVSQFPDTFLIFLEFLPYHKPCPLRSKAQFWYLNSSFTASLLYIYIYIWFYLRHSYLKYMHIVCQHNTLQFLLPLSNPPSIPVSNQLYRPILKLFCLCTYIVPCFFIAHRWEKSFDVYPLSNSSYLMMVTLRFHPYNTKLYDCSFS